MDDRDKALLDVVAKMPRTWTCIRCDRESPTHPGAEIPYAQDRRWDDAKRQYVIVGDVCKSCYGK